ncbi:MAG: Do family serine endopeptidase [Burkholderiales bacterium]|jgi:serine protease Do|nr:Do family serine endopeptidase [Burkholderiales bacterium]
MNLKPVPAALLAAGLLAVGSAGALGVSQMLQQPAAATAPAAPAPVTELAGTTPAGMPSYREIVRSYGPAVVGITVQGTHEAGGGQMPDFSSDPFLQFFRGLPGLRPMPPATPFRGQGSGFIVSADGLILTNAHVVRDAKEVTVRLSDRREFRARVLGADPATDVAVLKVDAANLPVVALGHEREVAVGDPVLAIGAPFGLEQTATQGIVSAKGRSLPGEGHVPFIQTDAAVNPGNSGGPLFDASGRVIGINAQIYSQSGGFQGLAFAIPIDVALRVKEQIVAHGKVEHARLGVRLQDLSPALAESFGLASHDGAVVTTVTRGSAAEKASLKAGDVITRIDGDAIRTGADVASRVGMASPGQKVRLTVWRDGSSRETEVALGKAEQAPVAAAGEPAPGALGLAVRPLSAGEKRQAGLDHGLVVEDVQGAAARAGIRPGDVLLSLNGRPIASVDEVRSVLAGKPKHVALLIQRDDTQIFVPINLG